VLPWEHAAIGYLAYSLLSHVFARRSPGALDAVAAIVGSQVPDLIDKPLAWQLGAFETSYALGHSIFFGVPAAVAAALLARSVGRGRVGAAFAVGYLFHLPGDVMQDFFQRGELPVEHVLWPVVTAPPTADRRVVDVTLGLFFEYVDALTSPDPPTLLLVQAGVIALTALLWLYDGAPVLRELLVGIRRRLAGAGRRSAN